MLGEIIYILFDSGSLHYTVLTRVSVRHDGFRVTEDLGPTNKQVKRTHGTPASELERHEGSKIVTRTIVMDEVSQQSS